MDEYRDIFIPRRVLVCGGAGFIGSHYVRLLTSRATGTTKVTVVDKLTYAGNLRNLADCSGEYSFIKGDIRDYELLSSIVPGHDLVVNFAAESHVDRSIRGATAFVENNTLGTQVLLQACLEAGVSKVIQISTDEVYGTTLTGSWNESASLAPRSPYAATKAGADMIAMAYWHTHGLPVCITRSCNNYGPFQFPEKIIPLFITRLLSGLPVPLYGDGSNIRQWVHATDNCNAIQHVVERGEPGEIYHIAGTVELSNRDLTSQILTIVGKDWDCVSPVADRKGHDYRYCVSDDKVRALGYHPRIDFGRGLEETVKWYRENQDWWANAGELRPAAPAASLGLS